MAAPRVANLAIGQWFEVLASQDADLNGVTVTTSTGASTLDDDRCLHVAAGQFAVFARSADPFVNGGLPKPVGRFTGSLSSNNERLGLFVGDSGLDEVAFYKSAAGISWQRNLELGDHLGPEAFCLSTQAWPDGGGDFGTPGSANTPCAATPSTNTCIDLTSRFAREIISPPPGALVITEVMADPAAVSDELGEWFEVQTTAPFDLNGLSLGNDGTATSLLNSRECRAVDAGATLLFARNAQASSNGGLPPVDGVFSFSLANSGARFVRVLHDTTELARFGYTSSTSGASEQADPVSGLRCVTPETQRYGGARDRGTPGQPNPRCP
jgi:hypothetical protein